VKLGVVDTFLRDKAKRLGVKMCRCVEPDIRWDETINDFGPRCLECNGEMVGLDAGERDALWTARGWRTETCHSCRGYGVVSVYSAQDFEGAGPCKRCGESGRVWVSPKGRRAHYPGGPFCG
jgi:hypothetical protein